MSVVALLQELIRIDSRNSLPMDKEGVRAADEWAMCRFLSQRLNALGFEVHIEEAAPSRPNLTAVHTTIPGAPFLALEAHMDTVGTEGMTMDPFDPVIRDKRVFGRGACDTKGSMAAMLTAAADLIAAHTPVNLMLIASCAEETGCEGASCLDLSRWSIRGIIVGEPTSNRPVIAHKANACFDLDCRGKAAHGALPQDGINAISRAAALVRFLEREIVPELTTHSHPLFAGSTLSVNLIAGGSKANIIPDRCTVTCDLRLVPGYGLLHEWTTAIAERATAALGFAVELTWSHTTPGMDTPPTCPLADAVTQALVTEGLDSTQGSVGYCTDGGVFATRGIDSIVLGPGDIRQAHGAVEFLELSQLHEAVRVYRAIGMQMAGLA